MLSPEQKSDPDKNYQFRRFSCEGGAPETLAMADPPFSGAHGGTETVKIINLRLDGGTQGRGSIDLKTVETYSDLMLAGVKFPPVLGFYDGSNIWVYDGFHRIGAAKAAGFDEIAVLIKQGTQQDAIWCSTSVNASHGLRRTRSDIRRAIEMALRHPNSEGWADRRIAEHVGCSPTTVGEVRKTIKGTVQIGQSVRTDKNGRTIDVSNIGRNPKAPVDKPSVPEPVVATPPTPPPDFDADPLEGVPVPPPGIYHQPSTEDEQEAGRLGNSEAEDESEAPAASVPTLSEMIEASGDDDVSTLVEALRRRLSRWCGGYDLTVLKIAAPAATPPEPVQIELEEAIAEAGDKSEPVEKQKRVRKIDPDELRDRAVAHITKSGIKISTFCKSVPAVNSRTLRNYLGTGQNLADAKSRAAIEAAISFGGSAHAQ